MTIVHNLFPAFSKQTILSVTNFTEHYSCWTFVTVVKRKSRQELNKTLARKKRRAEKWEALQMMVGVKGLSSLSLMNKYFGMCSPRLNQNPQQGTSVPLQGIFISHVTYYHETSFPRERENTVFEDVLLAKVAFN
jgi:hypothetical protein